MQDQVRRSARRLAILYALSATCLAVSAGGLSTDGARSTGIFLFGLTANMIALAGWMAWGEGAPAQLARRIRIAALVCVTAGFALLGVAFVSTSDWITRGLDVAGATALGITFVQLSRGRSLLKQPKDTTEGAS